MAIIDKISKKIAAQPKQVIMVEAIVLSVLICMLSLKSCMQFEEIVIEQENKIAEADRNYGKK